MHKKPFKIPTPQNLANIALHYLGRYAASEASLRRVLANRLRRASLQDPIFASDQELQQKLRQSIDNIVAVHKKTGVLNDAVFAEIKVNSLRRQGRSQRAIQQKLNAKGISAGTVTLALTQHADGSEPQEAELKAALVLAKRRKLGPFRTIEASEELKRKDFATLARAGFSSNIARKILKTEAPEEWD